MSCRRGPPVCMLKGYTEGEMSARADREFGQIQVTRSDWPIVLIEFPEKRVTDADLHAVLEYVESLLHEAKRNKEKVFVITDLTAMREITPASQRQFSAEWIKRTASLNRAASVGGATVTPSAILRGIITAVYWLQPSPSPTFPVATRHEAMLKGIEMLEAGNVLLSPRLVEYRNKHGVESGRFTARR
jgi:hypothetical protein